MEVTFSSSMSAPSLCSALAIADSTTFLMMSAPFFEQKVRMLNALSTFLPRTRSATRRAFCGDRCTPLSIADTCIVMLLLLSLLVGGMTLERTGQCEFAELVANHVFRNQHRNMLLAIVNRN